MNERGTQHLMRIGCGAGAVVLFETRRTMNRFGGEIPGAIESQSITAFEKDHLFQRLATLQLSKGGLERWTKRLGRKRIEHLSHIRVARRALNAVDGFQVGVCTLLVVVEKRGAFE